MVTLIVSKFPLEYFDLRPYNLHIHELAFKAYSSINGNRAVIADNNEGISLVRRLFENPKDFYAYTFILPVTLVDKRMHTRSTSMAIKSIMTYSEHFKFNWVIVGPKPGNLDISIYEMLEEVICEEDL